MNGEIHTTLGDGSPVVFTPGAWKAVGDMLRERQELDGREAEELGRATHETFFTNGQDPNLPGPTH
ncbi:MAG: hypothetical protein WCF18_01605 [Chthoniobacteraceae bacterium]